MNFGDRLHNASIRESPYHGPRPERDRYLDEKFAEFEREYADRSNGRIKRAKLELNSESIEHERAAYEAACRYEHDGDLDSAIEWYHQAARSDFSDAAYRLAMALEKKADNIIYFNDYDGFEGVESVLRIYRSLGAEVTRWYAEAYLVGHVDAPKRSLDFLQRFQEGLRILARRGMLEAEDETNSWKCLVIEAHAAAFLAGQLSENEAQAVREHLHTCHSCQRSYSKATDWRVVNMKQNPIQTANRRFVRNLDPRNKLDAG